MLNQRATINAMLLTLNASAAAFAQSTEELSNINATPVTPAMFQGGSYARTTYTPRSYNLYDVGEPAETGGAWAGGSATVYDDIAFDSPCPFALHDLEVLIGGMALGFFKGASSTADHLYTRASFYPHHDAAVAPTANPYSGTPVVGVVDWGAGWSQVGAGFLTYFPNPVPLAQPLVRLDSTNAFIDTPGACGVKLELFIDAALTVRANSDGWQIARRANHTRLLGGSSDTWAWYDQSNTATDLTNAQRTGGGALGVNSRATYMAFTNGIIYECPHPPLCSPDFDRDGDFGTDADIEAFFACLAGICCPACDPAGSDFNHDGDYGTDADIESFFRVLAGGPC